jgi:hypothetical protein
VRDEAPNLQIKDVILCCLVRAITNFREVTDEYGEMVKCWLAEEKPKKLRENMLQCHFIYHTYLGKSSLVSVIQMVSSLQTLHRVTCPYRIIKQDFRYS